MKKIKALWELTRLEHGVMIAIAILIGSLIAQKTFLSLDVFILTFFTALFLEASTFALNDYFDLEIDKKNKRIDRPLVRGDITPKTALLIFFILFPLGIISSYYVNLTCFIIAVITAIFAILYDSYLKKIKLVGNFFIAYVMAVPFVFGGAAVLPRDTFSLTISPVIFIIAFIAFLAGSGREIMKDVMDFEGDKILGVRSFPRYIGNRKSNMIAAFFYLIAIVLSLFPFFSQSYDFYYLNYYYLLLIFITDTMLLSTSFHLMFKKQVNLRYHRKFTLVAFFVGLLAFLVGALTG
jgi:geranylgeranylglycerol-phosphate geranylgeranyltransferase